MDNKLDKILEKLDSQGNRLTSIEKDVGRNADDLKDHMAQTKAVVARVAPLEAHVADVRKALTFLKWLIGVLAAAGIKTLWK